MHLTLSPTRTTRKAAAAAATVTHARSASEPCHPALERLECTVRALRAWSCCCCSGGAMESSSTTAAATGYGLALLEAVLAALGDLLATPRAAAALRGAAGDAALDGLLALADAHGTFGAALLAARQGAADERAGARRGDGAAVAASARARRRNDKELRLLAASMRHASRHAELVVPSSADDTGAEVISVVAEATLAAAEASAAVFSRCAAMSPDASGMVQTVSSSHRWLARLGVAPAGSKVAPETASVALERLEELEECIAGLESRSEKVFRRLLQARVQLLNIHNPL